MPSVQDTLFVSRNGRLITSYDLDLAATHSYNIDNVPVLSFDSLGMSVIKSNLRTVGTLTGLEVDGDTVLGGFAFFNSSFNQLGIGTENPQLAIDILENNVEIVIGSSDIDFATIGVHSNHSLNLITDNQTRLTISNDGAITVPGSVTITGLVKTGGDLIVGGTLTVGTIVSDVRIDRAHPIQFTPDAEASIYGLGLMWQAPDRSRQFTLASGPDRLWSTENIDLATSDRSYMVEGNPVLSLTQLGKTVTSSSLTSLGTLVGLSVAGNIQASTISFNGNAVLNDSGIDASSYVHLSIENVGVFSGNNTQIIVGDITQQTRPVKVFGPLSVNINNPDPTMDFSVNGNVQFGGRRFINADQIPTSGMFTKGDICWNTTPAPSGYVGWICVADGTPGEWRPFGQISPQ